MVRVTRRYFTISSLKRIDIFLHKREGHTNTGERCARLRTRGGASTDRRRSSVDATSKTPSSGGGTQKGSKTPVFIRGVRAGEKKCGPEEVKCVPHWSSGVRWAPIALCALIFASSSGKRSRKEPLLYSIEMMSLRSRARGVIRFVFHVSAFYVMPTETD